MMGQDMLAIDLLDSALQDGGGTFQSNGVKIRSDHFTTDVWVVGGKTPSLKRRLNGSVLPADIQVVSAWLFNNPSDIYGSWLEDETGITYIDAVDLVEDQFDAVVMGKERGELALYNMVTGETVELKHFSLGDGWVSEMEG